MARASPRSTLRYSDQFKATAVRLSQMPGVAVQDVAQSLYIRPFMLSLWRKQAREGAIVTKRISVDKEVMAELKELRRVKKAYEQLKLEHDLLKKRSRSLPSENRRLCLHRPPGRDPGEAIVSAVWSERERLLRVARPTG